MMKFDRRTSLPCARGTLTIGGSALPVWMGHQVDKWRRRDMMEVGVEVGDWEAASVGVGLD
jgi:hypothetical protein